MLRWVQEWALFFIICYVFIIWVTQLLKYFVKIQFNFFPYQIFISDFNTILFIMYNFSLCRETEHICTYHKNKYTCEHQNNRRHLFTLYPAEIYKMTTLKYPKWEDFLQINRRYWQKTIPHEGGEDRAAVTQLVVVQSKTTDRMPHM